MHTNSLVAVRMGMTILETMVVRQSFSAYPASGPLVYVDIAVDHSEATFVREPHLQIDAVILAHSVDSLGLMQVRIACTTRL